MLCTRLWYTHTIVTCSPREPYAKYFVRARQIMWIVEHDYHCTKKVPDSSSSFIVQKEIIIQMLHVIILFVSSWQQSTTISFCISCFSSFGFSFTTARSWKKVIAIVEGWQFVRLVVLILETRLGTNTTYCSPDYAQNVATN